MSKKNELSFEQAMEKLDSAVIKLESGDLSLEDSIKEFENAVELIKQCENKLSAAKQRVRILTEATDGTITDEPFINDSDET